MVDEHCPKLSLITEWSVTPTILPPPLPLKVKMAAHILIPPGFLGRLRWNKARKVLRIEDIAQTLNNCPCGSEEAFPKDPTLPICSTKALQSAFWSSRWHLSRHPFPGNSDACWSTRGHSSPLHISPFPALLWLPHPHRHPNLLSYLVSLSLKAH